MARQSLMDVYLAARLLGRLSYWTRHSDARRTTGANAINLWRILSPPSLLAVTQQLFCERPRNLLQ
jgi:hypothetical protein